MPNTGTTLPTFGTAPSSAAGDGPPADAVRLEGVTFGYGPAAVVRGISLAVPAGAFLTLLGPSGCGKTTLLKLIGGYLRPAAGRIALRGRDVTELPPERRHVGMVFQHYALFPHLSARRNVAFGLEVRRVPRAERDRKVEALLDRVGLSRAERNRRPAALSGGQQQRVALARALAIEPEVLLLDEPLANLDRRLRETFRAELRQLQRDTGVTTIMVTHDQEEALAVSDTIGVMAAGRVLQLGRPAEVYHRPRTPFVAGFLGEANFLDGALFGGRAGALTLVRPERCLLGPAAERCRWSWPGRVTALTFLGAGALVGVACVGGPVLRVRLLAAEGIGPGDRVCVGVPEDAPWPIPDADADGLPA
jgi:ABC-type Fe3+/spermidine/putrescine transport system ATPase subunit